MYQLRHIKWKIEICREIKRERERVSVESGRERERGKVG